MQPEFLQNVFPNSEKGEISLPKTLTRTENITEKIDIGFADRAKNLKRNLDKILGESKKL